MASPWDNISDTGETLHYELKFGPFPFSASRILYGFAPFGLFAIVVTLIAPQAGKWFDLFLLTVLSTFAILSYVIWRDRSKTTEQSKFTVKSDQLILHSSSGDRSVALGPATSVQLNPGAIVVTDENNDIHIRHIPSGIDGGPAFALFPLLCKRIPALMEEAEIVTPATLPLDLSPPRFEFFNNFVVPLMILISIVGYYFGRRDGWIDPNDTWPHRLLVLLGGYFLWTRVIPFCSELQTGNWRPCELLVDDAGITIISTYMLAPVPRERWKTQHFPWSDLCAFRSGFWPQQIQIETREDKTHELKLDSSFALPNYALSALIKLTYEPKFGSGGRISPAGIVRTPSE